MYNSVHFSPRKYASQKGYKVYFRHLILCLQLNYKILKILSIHLVHLHMYSFTAFHYTSMWKGHATVLSL